jgi:hypothetical protein
LLMISRDFQSGTADGIGTWAEVPSESL